MGDERNRSSIIPRLSTKHPLRSTLLAIRPAHVQTHLYFLIPLIIYFLLFLVQTRFTTPLSMNFKGSCPTDPIYPATLIHHQTKTSRVCKYKVSKLTNADGDGVEEEQTATCGAICAEELSLSDAHTAAFLSPLVD